MLSSKLYKNICFLSAIIIVCVTVSGCSPFRGRHPSVTPDIWPLKVKNPTVTSKYGMRHHPVLKRRIKHTGIDIRARDGTKVYATAPGRVIFAGWNGGYGNMVKIDHGDTLLTYYAHLSKIVVRKGDHVMKGSYIGLSGHSGRVTGPHLHYELRYKGKSVNPKWGLP